MPDTPVSAALMVRRLTRASRLLHVARDDLTAFAAARGDADHGANMDRGFLAVADALGSRILAFSAASKA